MIDIDCFKEYNDHYGHDAGDECLRQVAATFTKDLSRPGDMVARYGGEEFAVILPTTRNIDAYKLAERLREEILDLQLPHAFSKAGPVVSISIGCATAKTFAQTDSSDRLLERADKMLYRAKQMGRNRTMAEHETASVEDENRPDSG